MKRVTIRDCEERVYDVPEHIVEQGEHEILDYVCLSDSKREPIRVHRDVEVEDIEDGKEAED